MGKPKLSTPLRSGKLQGDEMTPPKPWPYEMQRIRDQAAENIQAAEQKIDKILKNNSLEPRVLLALMEIRVLDLNALRLLERAGASTKPAEI
jgi:hypothetical protein